MKTKAKQGIARKRRVMRGPIIEGMRLYDKGFNTGYEEGFRQGLTLCLRKIQGLVEDREAEKPSEPLEDRGKRKQLVRCDHYDEAKCGGMGVICRHSEEHISEGETGELSCGLFLCGTVGGAKVQCVPVNDIGVTDQDDW